MPFSCHCCARGPLVTPGSVLSLGLRLLDLLRKRGHTVLGLRVWPLPQHQVSVFIRVLHPVLRLRGVHRNLSAHQSVDVGVPPAPGLQQMVWGVGCPLLQKVFRGLSVLRRFLFQCLVPCVRTLGTCVPVSVTLLSVLRARCQLPRSPESRTRRAWQPGWCPQLSLCLRSNIPMHPSPCATSSA